MFREKINHANKEFKDFDREVSETQSQMLKDKNRIKNKNLVLNQEVNRRFETIRNR